MKHNSKPRPESTQYPQYIYDAAMQILRDGNNLTLHALATVTNETVEDVQKAILTLRNQRLAKMKPGGKRLADDPVLAVL